MSINFPCGKCGGFHGVHECSTEAALTYGKHAPNLGSATPVQVAEAMRVGPGLDLHALDQTGALARQG